jgi:glycolate oxidase FAD binding subunit
MDDLIKLYQDRINSARAASDSERVPLRIRGGGTKDFYGNRYSANDVLDVSGYSGVIDYEPKELVLTVRAGTTLLELERVVAQAGQMLPFEPPWFGQAATIGGTVACGFSGPRRPYVGAVRDFVLGARIINGKGEDLRFGGRVIKNVAGFDVSRLMVGALGTLGVLLDLSFKVLPKPQAELTLQWSMDEATAIQRVNEWAGQPLPLSASCYHDQVLRLRLSGAAVAVKAAHAKLGGDVVTDADAQTYWLQLREQQHAYFGGSGGSIAPTLLRLSVPTTTPPIALDGFATPIVEWGGGQRWYSASAGTTVDAARLATIRQKVAAVGGHATVFRAQHEVENAAANEAANQKALGVFHPLEPAVAGIHQRLKDSFDPARILNRGRMYLDL